MQAHDMRNTGGEDTLQSTDSNQASISMQPSAMAVIALVASAFGVAKRDVAILSGETSRDKRVGVSGDPATLAEIAERLYGAAP